MKSTFVLAIFLVSFLTAEAYRYNISLGTNRYKNYKNVQGDLVAKVYGKNSKTFFRFDDQQFGSEKVVTHELEFSDDEIDYIVLTFDEIDNNSGSFIVGSMKIENLDESRSKTFHPSMKIMNNDATSYYRFYKYDFE